MKLYYAADKLLGINCEHSFNETFYYFLALRWPFKLPPFDWNQWDF